MMITLPFSRVYHFNLIFFLFLSLTTFFNPISSRNINVAPYSTPSRISYSQHCSQIVSESTPNRIPLFTNQIPSFSNAYVINGDQILGPNSQITANFNPNNGFNTVTDGVYKIEASLVLRVARFRNRRNLFNVYGGPRFPITPRIVRFKLSGFWNSVSGQLCMVGLGTKRSSSSSLSSIGKSLEFDVVLKLNYPDNSTITSSLFTGTLESLNTEGSDSHFRPISIMGFANVNYEYTLINKEIDSGFEIGSNALSNVSMGVWGNFHSCNYFSTLSDNFELVYNSSCDGRNCSRLDSVFGFLPRFMSVNEIDCSDQRMIRVSFGFSDTSDIRHGYRQPLNPSRVLVAEGEWNSRNNQICFVACRIVNLTDLPLNASVGDCSIRVNFTFPASLTIRTPSVINGHIWSNKVVNESGYFDRSEIRASGPMTSALPGMKYKYTEIEKAKKYCEEKKKGFKHIGKSYPDPYSQDLKFDMDVRNNKGHLAWGRSHPVFVGNRFVQNTYPYFRSSVADSGIQVNSSYTGLLNVTYQLTFSPIGEFKLGSGLLTKNRTVISAEGTYDTETGQICMVGCWNREKTSTMDCDIFINIQISPRDSNNGDVVKGTIESRREKSDPLYFNRLDLSATSLTKIQVDNAFWRMDFEITMVLISNTLTCIFVGLQLFHVKRHPDTLPLISLVMLVLITLGHMIPLVLNMEALFLSSPSKRTMLFGSGGWLEVNEVLVRIITMLAFLLEFRLLQLTWYAKGDEGNPNMETFKLSEKKVILYSLPLYAGGALIAWLVQRLRGSPKKPFHHINLNPSTNPSLPFWGDVKSYAGFVLDAFLLPQIMFNVFSDSKGTSLSLPYYVGTTIVRLFPHGYDLFRAHSSSWRFDPWYIYANPGMNYYSTAWDILVSCLGVLFVIAIYLQQRFGGRSIIPRRFRENVAYEKVPVGL